MKKGTKHPNQKGKSYYHAPKVGRQPNGSFKCVDGVYVKDMRQQYIHDRMSGKRHGLAEATLKAYKSRVGQMLRWMEKTRGLQSWTHIANKLDGAGKSAHLEKYIEHLQRRPSQKGEVMADGKIQGLLDRSLGNHMAAIRWFANREGIKVSELNADYGMHRNRKQDEEKPINFPAGWQERRQEYQDKLEAINAATGAIAQLGFAYGLRAKERALSNTELRVREEMTVDGMRPVYLLSVAGRPFVEMTREQMTSQGYYKASFGKRLDRLVPGDYLIVRNAKGGRVRAQSIYNQERRDALDRIQDLCRANETPMVTNGTPPIAFPYQPGDITSDGKVSKTFMRGILDDLTDLYSKLGGTVKNLLQTNADRHFDTQRLYHCLHNGTDIRNNPEMMAYWLETHDKSIFKFSKSDIIEERGHSDGRKVCHYDSDPLDRY